ncbi:MAG: MGMT family protein [Candidatus Omnitrophica bacterium]|nr:MGMT family protein [Candidatus Omnitrophota bacterium]
MKKESKIKFTEFEKRVLRVVSTIPLGQTRSYKWVAQKAGRPKAVRAVGQALKKNPFPILIPCHRVIKNDGSIGGYSLGVDTKKRLLMFEKDITL